MKKVLSLVLAVVLAFGMCTVAFAAKNNVDDIKGDEVWVTDIGVSTAPDTVGGVRVKMLGNDVDLGDEVRADTNTKLYINPEAFEPVAGKTLTYTMAGGLTTSNLRTEKITVRRTISKGGDVLKSVDFDQESIGSVRYAFVKVSFVEHYISTSDKDFDYTIYLYVDNKRVDDTGITVSGTLKNPQIEVYAEEDYVSSEEGEVVKAEEYVRGINMYLGDGVTATLNMFSGTKYYGTAKQEVSAADDAVMAQYPEIETVYVIRQINLTGAKFKFDISETYYVYNADGEYIGMTSEELPYSAKYYLAKSRITMGGSEPVEPTEPVESEDPGTDTGSQEAPDMGGDDDANYENVNDNPGTGANGFVSVAVVAGVVALAAAGAVSMKK